MSELKPPVLGLVNANPLHRSKLLDYDDSSTRYPFIRNQYYLFVSFIATE